MTWFWRLAMALYLGLLPLIAILPTAPDIGFHINDKIAHAAAFLVLALLTDRALPGRRYDWVNFLSLLTLGMLIESMQYHTAYRSASIADLAADAIGLLAYGVLRSSIGRIRKAPPTRASS
ncbi:MAG TPA: VanZ family protein [Methylothermaceae bacterium]|nr:VanZ family protein [Methylothermaceae bacterium]